MEGWGKSKGKFTWNTIVTPTLLSHSQSLSFLEDSSYRFFFLNTIPSAIRGTLNIQSERTRASRYTVFKMEAGCKTNINRKLGPTTSEWICLSVFGKTVLCASVQIIYILPMTMFNKNILRGADEIGILRQLWWFFTRKRKKTPLKLINGLLYIVQGICQHF